MRITLERLEDNRLKVEVATVPDDWGCQSGSWDILDGTSTDDAVAAHIGRLVLDHISIPARRPATGEYVLNLGPVPAGPFTTVGGEVGSGSILDRGDGSVSSSAGVRELLDTAIETGGVRLLMRYTDRNGNESTRTIIPTTIKKERYGGQVFAQDYVMAVDTDIDEPRSFKLDRIRSLEPAR